MTSAPPPVPLGSTSPLGVTHRPHDRPLARPAMSNTIDRHDRFALTNRYVEVDGRPAIPVSGEVHYSRVPRDEWEERLRLMRAGGITVVATYVFWNHHEAERGHRDFGGGLDVAAFVALCERLEFDVVLRIGPWCHGEVRNGGFPDWVQDAPVAHRTDDPAYLALVDEWFAALGAQLAAHCGPSSRVIAIQLENELYDQPGHLVTLKRMARRHGLTAPISTATAWGGADLPAGEVLPLYGGYGDGFWVDADQPWDTTFREHFFFSHAWDDPGIGADLRDHPGIGRHDHGVSPRLPSPDFPAATCELGGGMATAYHRRPLLGALDIAAVAHGKIGNGSGWQGYYMYAGGLNPRPDLQESQATGYPNDLPVFDYDFHAPIGAAGDLAPSHAELRRQHAFLAAFGESLADMPSTLPDVLPTGVDDVETMRWAIRSDGASAWVFVNRQQPHVPLDTYRGARFAIGLDSETVVFPHDPVDVPPGTIAHWPVNLELGGVRLRWATASPLTVLGSPDHPTLVLVAEAGIPVELAVDDASMTDASGATREVAPGVFRVDAAEPRVVDVVRGDARLRVLVLPAASARRALGARCAGRARTAPRAKRRAGARGRRRPTRRAVAGTARRSGVRRGGRRVRRRRRRRARAGPGPRAGTRSDRCRRAAALDVRRARRPRCGTGCRRDRAARLDVVAQAAGCRDRTPGAARRLGGRRRRARGRRTRRRRPVLGRHAVDHRTRRAGPHAGLGGDHPHRAAASRGGGPPARRGGGASAGGRRAARRARRRATRGLAALARGADGALTAGAVSRRTRPRVRRAVRSRPAAARARASRDPRRRARRWMPRMPRSP